MRIESLGETRLPASQRPWPTLRDYRMVIRKLWGDVGHNPDDVLELTDLEAHALADALDPAQDGPTVESADAGRGSDDDGSVLKPDLVGLKEIAERLGVARKTAGMWRVRGLLPPPGWTIGGYPVWLWDTIVAWAVRTGRYEIQ